MYVASIRLDFHLEWMEFDQARLDLLSLFHVKHTQSTAMEQKPFDLRSLSSALRNLWLLLVCKGVCWYFVLYWIVGMDRRLHQDTGRFSNNNNKVILLLLTRVHIQLTLL